MSTCESNTRVEPITGCYRHSDGTLQPLILHAIYDTEFDSATKTLTEKVREATTMASGGSYFTDPMLVEVSGIIASRFSPNTDCFGVAIEGRELILCESFEDPLTGEIIQEEFIRSWTYTFDEFTGIWTPHVKDTELDGTTVYMVVGEENVGTCNSGAEVPASDGKQYSRRLYCSVQCNGLYAFTDGIDNGLQPVSIASSTAEGQNVIVSTEGNFTTLNGVSNLGYETTVYYDPGNGAGPNDGLGKATWNFDTPVQNVFRTQGTAFDINVKAYLDGVQVPLTFSQTATSSAEGLGLEDGSYDQESGQFSAATDQLLYQSQYVQGFIPSGPYDQIVMEPSREDTFQLTLADCSSTTFAPGMTAENSPLQFSRIVVERRLEETSGQITWHDTETNDEVSIDPTQYTPCELDCECEGGDNQSIIDAINELGGAGNTAEGHCLVLNGDLTTAYKGTVVRDMVTGELISIYVPNVDGTPFIVYENGAAVVPFELATDCCDFAQVKSTYDNSTPPVATEMIVTITDEVYSRQTNLESFINMYATTADAEYIIDSSQMSDGEEFHVLVADVSGGNVIVTDTAQLLTDPNVLGDTLVDASSTSVVFDSGEAGVSFTVRKQGGMAVIT